MAFTEAHVLFGMHGVFGGSAGTPVEEWTTTLRIKTGVLGPTVEGDLEAFLDAIDAEAQSFHGGNTAMVGGNCFLTELTAAQIGTDGKYTGGGSQVTTSHPISPAKAGFGTTLAPYSTALVRSLRTDRQRGRASNGRMYYPGTGWTIVNTDGTIDGAAALAAAVRTAEYVQDINAAAAAHLSATASDGVAVFSFVGAGTTEKVTHVRVGRRLDHMESRERGILEDWQIAAVPTS